MLAEVATVSSEQVVCGALPLCPHPLQNVIELRHAAYRPVLLSRTKPVRHRERTSCRDGGLTQYMAHLLHPDLRLPHVDGFSVGVCRIQLRQARVHAAPCFAKPERPLFPAYLYGPVKHATEIPGQIIYGHDGGIRLL